MRHVKHVTSASSIINKFLLERWIHFPKSTMNDYQSFQGNLEIKNGSLQLKIEKY